MAILEVEHLEKRFGGTPVLQDVSFSLEQGQTLAILGSSGSGKTTLLRCLNALEQPDAGRIRVAGETLFDGGVRAAKRGGRLPFGLVFQAFNRLMQGRTSFIVAHRLSTIREADVILVMKDGHIIEQGNHRTLLEKNGFYAELYRSQFDI